MSIELSGNAQRRPFFAGLLDRLRRTVNRWNEIQRLDSREIEAIAHELNLSKTELNALMFAPSSAVESLSKRISYVGLSEAELAASQADVLRDMRRVCSQCSYQGRCIRDLKHRRRATPAKYCPNEQTLRALADERRQSTSQILLFPAGNC
jgi:uncharacterized protein DUF6455